MLALKTKPFERNLALTRLGIGTGGRFVDFGAGTPVELHGKERVMTEAEGRQELAGLGALENRLVSIERLLRDQPRAFGVAMSDSLTLMN